MDYRGLSRANLAETAGFLQTRPGWRPASRCGGGESKIRAIVFERLTERGTMAISSGTPEEHPTRELAAIMFSDIAGYTAIMGRDEQEAIRAIDAHRALLRQLLPRFNGRILGEIGDGTLSSFHSAVDAVNCAREVQGVLTNNSEMSLRIGIHVGDVVFTDTSVLGDGVNIASRIHALANPGGICISERVYDEIRNKPDLPVRNLGEKTFKNVNRPIRVYALSGFGGSDSGSGAASLFTNRSLPRPVVTALILGATLLVCAIMMFNAGEWRNWIRGQSPRITSLAVLPLVNLSGDPKQEYFADGMTEELTTDLAQIGALRVTSRTSTMQFKNTTKAMPKIAKELDVDAILEGSVVRIGDRVRITAQLIEGRTDRHLWAKNYQRDSRDVLALQDEVARDIADEIRLELTAKDRARLASARAIDPEAHDLYLRGRFFWNARTEESLAKAQNYFQQAIAKDPLFAPAYSGLADTYVYRGYIWGHVPPREAMPQARAAALKALQLDDDSAEGHTSLALVKFLYDWDFKGAKDEFKRAIALNPNYASAHHFYSIDLAAMGRSDESIAQARKAVEADPLSIPVNNILGESLAEAKHYDEAIAQFRKTVEMDPNNPLLHFNLCMYLGIKGHQDESFEEYIKWMIAEGANPSDAEAIRKIYKAAGWSGVYKASLGFLSMRWEKDHWHVDAFNIATLHLELGEKTEAFEWFNKCIELHSGTITWLLLGEPPGWVTLRADPRWAEIKRTMALPP